MVDFAEGGAMAGDQNLEGRLGRVEEKLDALTVSVDARFDAVTEAIVEQRRYTEFAFDRLRSEMLAGFGRIDGRFDRMDSRFNRLERKLDQFIDTQSKTNELVERRLQALESSRPPQ